jgi:hypothetical protein
MIAPVNGERGVWRRWAVPLCALASLLPLILLRGEFAKLFWFGDDWDRLSDLMARGFWKWSVVPWAENFCPVFKLFWTAALDLGRGGYFFMILCLWLTHAAILWTFGRLMEAFAISRTAICFVLLTAGLTPANIETLGWATQWNALLSLLFFVAAWRMLPGMLRDRPQLDQLILYGVLLCASGACFARGVLSGLVLALFILLSEPPAAWRKRTPILLASLIPCVVFAAFDSVYGSADSISAGLLHNGNLLKLLEYGAYFIGLGPLFSLFGFTSARLGPAALIGFGLTKAGLMYLGFRAAKKEARPFLLALLGFDLVNAILVSLGRYQGGVWVSSRYQYAPLLCLLPFAGVLLDRAAGLLTANPRYRLAAVILLTAGWVGFLTAPWQKVAAEWAQWRGVEVRQTLDWNAPDDHFGASSLSTRRAREVAAFYDLH